MSEEVKAPPIGIMPEPIWRGQRMDELIHAISRYRISGHAVPKAWLEELGTLISKALQESPTVHIRGWSI